MPGIVLKNETVRTSGKLPESGTQAPDFNLVSTELSDVGLSDFKGKRLILNVFLSTEIVSCAESIRMFNELANSLENVDILSVSRDLPFALERFATQEGVDNVTLLSEMRNTDFGDSYGLRIVEGPLKGLLARAVIVIDGNQKVIYTEMVSGTGEEPDYQAAVKAAEAADAGSSRHPGAYPTESGLDEFCEKKPTGEHARLLDDDDACDESRSGKL